MQAFSGLFDGPRMIAVIYPGSLGKHQLGAKANGTSPPHNCGLIIVLQCSGKKFLQSGFARKQVTINMAGPL